MDVSLAVFVDVDADPHSHNAESARLRGLRAQASSTCSLANRDAVAHGTRTKVGV